MLQPENLPWHPRNTVHGPIATSPKVSNIQLVEVDPVKSSCSAGVKLAVEPAESCQKQTSMFGVNCMYFS